MHRTSSIPGVSWLLGGILVAAALAAGTNGLWPESHRGKPSEAPRLVDALSAATGTGVSTVGLVGSDYQELDAPVPRDQRLGVDQVEDMVRTAVDLAGGLDAVLDPDARRVVIKPDICELKQPGSGVVTDWRVVRAVVLVVHEMAPQARICIAEGGTWLPADKAAGLAAQGVPAGPVGDGFATAGYRTLLEDPDLKGIPLDLVDLNFDPAESVPVPGGGYVLPEYYIPRTLLESDFVICVPVLKISESVGMSNVMANLVGIAPGTYYGWPKTRGRPDLGIPGLPGLPSVRDELIVDLTCEAEPDFTVVDAIVGMERAGTDSAGLGRPRRLDTVLASADIVAADAVSALLIGLDPADIEYLSLAARRGLGQDDPARIQIDGSSLDRLATRFEKTPAWRGSAGEWGHYGQGCRTWLVTDPFPRGAQPAAGEFIAVERSQALPGKNGWSEPVYFHDDEIDLDAYFHDPTDCVVYAHSDFFAPQAQDAELWVGSDEEMRVWIDGQRVYEFAGRRRHHLPNDRVPIHLTGGWHRLLVRADQSSGPFGFSLDICDVEPDPRYDGNRVWGLTFAVRGPGGQPVAAVAEVMPPWLPEQEPGAPQAAPHAGARSGP